MSVVFNPPWRYEYTPGDERAGAGAGGMSPFDPCAWQLSYFDVARLDCLWEARLPDRRGSDWPRDIDLIKYLFKVRQPRPREAWRFAVRDEPHAARTAGVPLKVLEIESFLGTEHHSLYRYTFDPARGYETVRGFRQEHWRDGRHRYTIDAKQDVKEVAPGVWRVAGVNVERKGHDLAGRPTMEIVTITSSKAAANFEPIPDAHFTLTGLGVPPEGAAELEAEWSRHTSKGK